MSPSKEDVLSLIDDYLASGTPADALKRLTDLLDELSITQEALRSDLRHMAPDEDE